jgi:hypothetical protein
MKWYVKSASAPPQAGIKGGRASEMCHNIA